MGSNGDLAGVQARLTRLERENRRLKVVGLLLMLAMGGLVLMGAEGEQGDGAIEAKRIVIEDANGKTIIRAGQLILASKTTTSELRPGLLFLKDERGMLTADGPRILMSEAGKPKETGFLMIGINGPGEPQVHVEDRFGTRAVLGVLNSFNKKKSEFVSSSASSIHLFGKKKRKKVITVR